MIRSGEEGQGQPMNGGSVTILVDHNFRGDVMIVRRGDTVSWLDMSADVAVDLALALLHHAGRSDLRLRA